MEYVKTVMLENIMGKEKQDGGEKPPVQFQIYAFLPMWHYGLMSGLPGGGSVTGCFGGRGSSPPSL